MSGVTSGALAQFFASPTDLVKVQIQMEGKRRLLGKPPRFVKCLLCSQSYIMYDVNPLFISIYLTLKEGCKEQNAMETIWTKKEME
jgi:hypothetical protein